MADMPQQAHAADDAIQERISKEYEWGFVTDVEEDKPPKGLSEDVVRAISARKNEPEWLLEWRLRAYRAWIKMGARRTDLGQHQAPEDRLPGHPLLLGPEASG